MTQPRRLAAWGATLALLVPLARAQQPPPAPVRHTVALAHPVRPTVRLSGTVESVHRSTVAAEIAGLVETLAVREGDRVEQGATLAELRRRPLQLRLEATRAELQEAVARLGQAERRLTRARELYQGQVATLQQLDDARTDHDAWKATTARLEASGRVLDDQLARAVIRAPFAGVVVARLTEVGQWLGEGAGVAVLVAAADLEIRVDAPEQYFGQIVPGQSVAILIPSAPEGDFQGDVRAVVTDTSRGARTFPVYVRIDRPDPRVAPGMLSEVRLGLGQPRPVVVVPKDAIVSHGSQRAVFVIGDDDIVQQIQVELGASVGDWIEVRGPLTAGTRVVTRGNERLFPGTAVSGEPLEYPAP